MEDNKELNVEETGEVSGGVYGYVMADNGAGPHVHNRKSGNVSEYLLCGYWDYFQIYCHTCGKFFYLKSCGKDDVIIDEAEYNDTLNKRFRSR